MTTHAAASAPLRRRRRKSWLARNRSGLIRHGTIGVFVLIILLPLAWVLLLSVKSLPDSMRGQLWPRKFDLSHYGYVFDKIETLPTNLFNSIYVTGATVLITTACAVLAGYALVHVKPRGTGIIVTVFLVSLYFPIRVVSIISIYEIQNALDLINSTSGLILPYPPGALPLPAPQVRQQDRRHGNGRGPLAGLGSPGRAPVEHALVSVHPSALRVPHVLKPQQRVRPRAGVDAYEDEALKVRRRAPARPDQPVYLVLGQPSVAGRRGGRQRDHYVSHQGALSLAPVDRRIQVGKLAARGAVAPPAMAHIRLARRPVDARHPGRPEIRPQRLERVADGLRRLHAPRVAGAVQVEHFADGHVVSGARPYRAPLFGDVAG